jgi:hypothetical protein
MYVDDWDVDHLVSAEDMVDRVVVGQPPRRCPFLFFNPFLVDKKTMTSRKKVRIDANGVPLVLVREALSFLTMRDIQRFRCTHKQAFNVEWWIVLQLEWKDMLSCPEEKKFSRFGRRTERLKCDRFPLFDEPKSLFAMFPSLRQIHVDGNTSKVEFSPVLFQWPTLCDVRLRRRCWPTPRCLSMVIEALRSPSSICRQLRTLHLDGILDAATEMDMTQLVATLPIQLESLRLGVVCLHRTTLAQLLARCPLVQRLRLRIGHDSRMDNADWRMLHEPTRPWQDLTFEFYSSGMNHHVPLDDVALDHFARAKVQDRLAVTSLSDDAGPFWPSDSATWQRFVAHTGGTSPLRILKWGRCTGPLDLLTLMRCFPRLETCANIRALRPDIDSETMLRACALHWPLLTQRREYPPSRREVVFQPPNAFLEAWAQDPKDPCQFHTLVFDDDDYLSEAPSIGRFIQSQTGWRNISIRRGHVPDERMDEATERHILQCSNLRKLTVAMHHIGFAAQALEQLLRGPIEQLQLGVIPYNRGQMQREVMSAEPFRGLWEGNPQRSVVELFHVVLECGLSGEQWLEMFRAWRPTREIMFACILPESIMFRSTSWTRGRQRVYVHTHRLTGTASVFMCSVRSQFDREE